MTGPLAGVLAVDLSRAVAGPHAAMMLGDLGARVIKVERVDGGDDSRGWGPPFVGVEPETESTYFLSCNRNKESITLDLKADDDAALLRRLIERADVLVENFRPGTLERLGFAPESLAVLNPRLIVLSISGFGHDGPERDRPGYDQIAQGEAGLMSLTGSAPGDATRIGVPISDILAGMYGASGVLAALHERERTGRGQVVRTSLLAASVGAHSYQGTRWTVGREVGQAEGNHHPSLAPYGLFRSPEGAVQIAVGSESLWRDFCGAIDLDARHPDFATNRMRVAHRDLLIEMIEAEIERLSRDEFLRRLHRAGVPAGLVRTLDEVYSAPQTRSQGLVVTVDHGSLGAIDLPGPPLRFFDPDGTERTLTQHCAPPTLGQHNGAVRRWLSDELA